jgi:predicted amidophosphoribosyltransferase
MKIQKLLEKAQGISASEMVYNFCKENGICIQCQMQFSGVDTLKCEKCRLQVNETRRKYYKKTGK